MRVLIVAMVVFAGSAEAARVCQAPALAAIELTGHTPREVRALLQPLLGPPLLDTNQLTDGGTFAKLSEADAQDGVSQHYAWGGDAGTVDITFLHGRPATVELHLSEFETARGEQVLTACQSWPRDRFAAIAGLKLPKSASGGAHRLFRFDLGHGVIARLRCNDGSARGLCTALNIYLPVEGVPTPQTSQGVPTPQISQGVPTPQKQASASPKKSSLVAQAPRRALKTR